MAKATGVLAPTPQAAPPLDLTVLPLCLCLRENQPFLGLMGSPLAARKLGFWKARG